MFKKILRWLGSLQLAMILLIVMTSMVIWGTIVESGFTAEVARKYIYASWFFDLWLFMLATNLFCVAAIRYPWKPHQTGFVITHAGIIVLLLGAFIDRHWGIEGFIPLYRGDQPTDVMELHEQDVWISKAGEGAPARTRTHLKELTGRGDMGFSLNTPDPAIKASAVDLFPPAVKLVLTGAKMGRFEQWLFQGDNLNMGPATLKFVSGMPPAPKVKAPEEMETADKAPRLERYFAFANHETPISKTLQGQPTNAKPKLVIESAAGPVVEQDGGKPILHLDLMDKHFHLDVTQIANKKVPLEGLPDWTIYVFGYYPNFVMGEDGKPANRNNKPENPAIVFELQGPLVAKTDRPADSEEPHGPPSMGNPGDNALTLYLGTDGKLRYLLKSRVKGESVGELGEGITVAAGWAGDAAFTIERFIPTDFTKALIVDEKKEEVFREKNPGQLYVSEMPLPNRLETRPMGMMVRLEAGGETKDVWVQLSTSQAPRKEFVQVGGHALSLALPRRAVRLPFKIALEKFYAPHQPGMKDSNMFMAFESTLSFQDKADPGKGLVMDPPKQLDFVRIKEGSIALEQLGKEHAMPGDPTLFRCAISQVEPEFLQLDFEDKHSAVIARSNVVEFTKNTHKIHMNHPTTYPQTPWGPFLGTSYKFSQADHQMPQNPDYSGVQVLRDPGWFFKWVGCLGICFGIFTMFYLKPYFRPKVKKADDAEEVKGKKKKKGKAELSHA